MSIQVRRLHSGEEQAWQDAVAVLVPCEDREGYLASIEEIAEGLADDRCYLLLASRDGDTCGLLSAFRFPDVEAGGKRVYLYDIEVDAGQRRLGAGSALVKALADACVADGVEVIWAGTERNNLAARATFEATGAVLDGDRYVEYEWDLEQ